QRDGRVLDVVAASGAQLTARWLPWNAEGTDPADWVGVDSNGRAVVGFVRSSLGLADAPVLIAAAARLTGDLDSWAPGAVAPVEIIVGGTAVSSEIQRIVAAAGFALH